jgi:hypothetical protein
MIADEVMEGIQDTEFLFPSHRAMHKSVGPLHTHDGILLCDVRTLLVTDALIKKTTLPPESLT